jgi:hypothetical protein
MRVKLIITTLALFFLGLNSVNAQSSNKLDTIKLYCGSPRVINKPPLYIIVTSAREIQIPTDVIKDIKPDWILSINVLNDSAGTIKYGDKGKNGVILLSLREEKLQEALKTLKLQD